MNKSKLCNIVRSHYPKAFGIRKNLSRLKVKRYLNHILPAETTRACENDFKTKQTTVTEYAEKWKEYLKPEGLEMEELLLNAPSYKEREDKDMLRTDMMFCRMAYGFTPTEYLCYSLEGKSMEERRAFVSDIDRYRFTYSVNDIAKLQIALDKAQEYAKFSKFYQREAIWIEKDKDFDKFEAFVRKHPVFVKKAVHMAMGKSVALVDLTKTDKSVREVFRDLIAGGKHIIEERVIQSGTMAKLNESSVNTIRCITLNTRHGVVPAYCFMKVGRAGAFVDNGGAGGILVGIDKETGVLDTDGFDEYFNRYSSHPDSGITFKGYALPEWSSLIALCKKLAMELPELGYIGWDLAHTESGWCVIEVNGLSQVIGPQTVYQKGLREELETYIKDMDCVF